jgi:hypothetical protein
MNPFRALKSEMHTGWRVSPGSIYIVDWQPDRAIVASLIVELSNLAGATQHDPK